MKHFHKTSKSYKNYIEKMRPITAYETTDGKLYKNEKEADTHQKF